MNARPPALVVGITNPLRLQAVAQAELHGHLGDSSLDAIVETLRVACRVPAAAVHVVTPGLQTLAGEVGIGLACSTAPAETCFCGQVVENGCELVIGDARAHPTYRDNPLVARGVVGAYAGIPLIDDNVVLGAVSIFDPHPRGFTDDELAVLRYQARVASNVLTLRRSARSDILTGLPNRTLCLENLTATLSRLDRDERGVAVMFGDVDGFKAVNDTLGHDVGDQLLVELAQRMRTVLRPTDMLARFGGDEFVVVCEHIATAEEAAEVVERLLAAVGGLIEIDAHKIEVGLSLGVALATSATQSAASLIRAADAAMYQAKQRGWVRWQLARPERAAAPVVDAADPQVERAPA